MKNRSVLIQYQRVCKEFYGGITAIAGIMDISPVILANKLNPDNETNHLTLDEVSEIIKITGDKSLVSALAVLISQIVIPMPECASKTRDVLSNFIDVFSACGGVGEEIKQATDIDSELGEKLSRKEKKRINGELDSLINASFCLKQSIAE